MHQTFRREGKPTDILDRMRSQSRGRPAATATEPSSACAMHPRVGDPACNPGDLLRMTCGQLVCRGSALAHRIILPNCASCHATLQQSMQRDVIDPWKARYAVPPPPPLLALPPPQPANHFLYSSAPPSPSLSPPPMSWNTSQQQQQQQFAPRVTRWSQPAHPVNAAPYPHSVPLPPRPAPLPPVSDATTKALANLMSMLQQ